MNKFITEFSSKDWQDYPKDHFDVMIKSWCEKHGYKHYDIHNKEMVFNRLPYRFKEETSATGVKTVNHEVVEVAADFLGMVERRRTLDVFQPSLV